MIHILVKNRDKIVFEGDIENITSYNKVGLFNVLDDHANFISIIQKQLIIKQNGRNIEIPVENGLLKVRENKAWVYLGIK